jgi:hypothetical protein
MRVSKEGANSADNGILPGVTGRHLFREANVGLSAPGSWHLNNPRKASIIVLSTSTIPFYNRLMTS